MGGQEKYVCDADSLINLYRHFERACIRSLRDLARSDSLRIPEGVAGELRRGTDKLSNFIDHVTLVRLSKHPEVRKEVARMEKLYGQSIRIGKQTYQGFWASRAGRKAADSQVVAVAKVFGLTVVSDDRAVRNACLLENISCIGWAEFARRLRMAGQLRLFE